MGHGDTHRQLDEITDEGLFERLATAVLREIDPDYRLLIHPGVNVDGKTVKSPLDAIAFVPGATPPHMIAVHHTTALRDALERKWLHEPTNVKPRKGKPTAPPGDLPKTIAIYEEQKRRMPNLRATLILTTNREPTEDLIREVSARAANAGITLKPFSRSTLAHYLDTEANGQWIRRQYLGTPQERLSSDLLTALSHQSFDDHRPPDDQSLWVVRALDTTLAGARDQNISFVVGEAGSGKSIACYKRLSRHIEEGGYGLVLTHEVLEHALSLDHAVETVLRQLSSSLVAGSGQAARTLATEHSSLLLVAEDVNKASQPAVLIEKLARWLANAKAASGYRILCPVWPRYLAALGEDVRKHVSEHAIFAGAFSPEEGANAVQRRHGTELKPVARLVAETISNALGHDPLLIALHDPAALPQPGLVIGRFIDGSLATLSTSSWASFTAGEYRYALRRLAAAMLERRQLNPTLIDIARWFGSEPVTTMLRDIVRVGEVMRAGGAASSEQILFRHDRVRDHLLADAAAHLMRDDTLADNVLGEPFFAEVLGTAVVSDNIPVTYIDKLKCRNPLALFCALRAVGPIATQFHQSLFDATTLWLDEQAGSNSRNTYILWEAAQVLADIDAPYVKDLACRFAEPSNPFIQRARFRNGSAEAGIALCVRAEPGSRFVGHLELIQLVQQRDADQLVHALDTLLRGRELTTQERFGALRLAGHLQDARLGAAVAASWQTDYRRDEHLREYLWAAAQCAGADPAIVLAPVCDAWAALSDNPGESGSSPRNSLAAHGIRWAFHEQLAEPGLRYFICRAEAPDLEWPITYMLHGVDHPDAVEFIARRLAALAAGHEGTESTPLFVMSAQDEWSRNQEYNGRTMSSRSKDRLLQLWRPTANDVHLRRQAFRLWSATTAWGDLPILQSVDSPDPLADLVLRERVKRADRSALPALIDKIEHSDSSYWWQFCRHIWSVELTVTLDKELHKRGAAVERRWNPKHWYETDWITSELIMALSTQQAEALLLKHWDHLKFDSHFVQAALFVATPILAQGVADVVASCPEPDALFKHLTMRFGYKNAAHPRMSRIEQMQRLVPYLKYLDGSELLHLWDLCNDNGWFDLRRIHLDALVERKRSHYIDSDMARAELDELASKNEYYWGRRWAEQMEESGWSIDRTMGVLAEWLREQTSLQALNLAAHIIMSAGLRRHIALLQDHMAEPANEAARLVAHADFAVKRRSLH